MHNAQAQAQAKHSVLPVRRDHEIDTESTRNFILGRFWVNSGDSGAQEKRYEHKHKQYKQI